MYTIFLLLNYLKHLIVADISKIQTNLMILKSNQKFYAFSYQEYLIRFQL